MLAAPCECILHNRYFALHRFLNFKIDEYRERADPGVNCAFWGHFFHNRVHQILHVPVNINLIELNRLIFFLGLHLVL